MQLLRELDLDRWRRLDAAGRAVATDAMLTVLPPGLTPVRAAGAEPSASPRFLHQATGLELGVVFGQALTMGGAPPPEDWQPWMRNWPLVDCATVQPARRARVAPFLLADDFLAPDVLRRLGVPVDGSSGLVVPVAVLPALAPALATVGLRLPSEAEWELAATTGAVGNFSVFEELCADDWHDGYDGAPADGAPFGRGAEVLRSKVGGSVAAGLQLVRRRRTEAARPVVRVAMSAPW